MERVDRAFHRMHRAGNDTHINARIERIFEGTRNRKWIVWIRVEFGYLDCKFLFGTHTWLNIANAKKRNHIMLVLA